jgi:hypothetical protein
MRFDHITPVFRDELYWLPVCQRISYRIAMMVYRYMHGSAPFYLSRLVYLLSVESLSGRQGLRSASQGDLYKPPTRTHSSLTLGQFKNKHKTHIFHATLFSCWLTDWPSIDLALGRFWDFVKGRLKNVCYVRTYLSEISARTLSNDLYEDH